MILPPMIVLDRVSKYYGAHAAVSDLNIKIAQGECIGFLGLNGAGKTTTLRILSCLLLPSAGKVTIRGLDTESDPHEIRKFIGFLPDRPPLYPDMTVRDYLHHAGRLRAMSPKVLAHRMTEVFDSCGLHDVENQVISTLSHGYKQRVGIAQAIIHDPALLILDEPIQGLDPVQISQMRELIRSLKGKHTILFSTHILSEIQQTCDRILMLHGGKVIAQGSEEELNERLMSGARLVVELRVAGGLSAEAVRQRLEDLDGITGVDILDELGEVFAYGVLSNTDVRASLSRYVVEQGHGLLSLKAEGGDLEEMFLALNESVDIHQQDVHRQRGETS